MANLFIIMGVSGSGKSTIADQLAVKLDYSFIDADDFHSDSAKEKMAAGEALTEEVRSQWMQRLQRFLILKAKQGTSIVLAHSGLKKVHRDMLRVLGFTPHFLFLEGSEDVIAQRMQKRSEHFFPVGLLRSQFQTLEHPKISQQNDEEFDVSIISIEQSIAAILTQVEDAARTFIARDLKN